MSEATLEQRREAAADLRGEILAALTELRAAIGAALKPPPLVVAKWDKGPRDIRADLEAVRRRVEEQRPGQTVALPASVGVDWGAARVLGAFFDTLSKLAWLLGLSDAERAFVDDAASAAVASRLAPLCESLAVFADWLADQAREGDAGTIERIVPRTGDVLVYTHKGITHAEAEKITRAIHGALSRLGREILCVAVREGYTLAPLDAATMGRLGWVRADDIIREANAQFVEIGQEIAAEPEAEKGRLVSWNALAVIRRLKRENAELKACQKLDSVTLREALAAEREACLHIVETTAAVAIAEGSEDIGLCTRRAPDPRPRPGLSLPPAP